MVVPEFGRQSAFQQLERQVSADLLANDAVFELTGEQLPFEMPIDEELPLDRFIARPYYGGTATEQELEVLGDTQDKVPMGLQVETSGAWAVGPEEETMPPFVTLGLATYFYVKLGVINKDGQRMFLHDEAGRLHEVPRGKDGLFEVKPNAPFDIRRAKAVSAWQTAHNAMTRAAKADERISIDPFKGVYTDEPPAAFSSNR